MADIIENLDGKQERFRDMGDGTYARVVSDNNAAVTDAWDSTNHLLRVSLATALSQALDTVLTYPRGSNYQELSASGTVLTGAGKLSGIFVATASGTPTIKVWDNTAASGNVLLDQFTPVAGTSYSFPYARVGTGIYVTIGGTVTCTVFYDPTTT